MTLMENKAFLRWLDDIIDFEGLKAVNGGMSGATIYKVISPQGYIMKVKQNDIIRELTYEMAMYDYLKDKMPVPKTIYFGDFKDYTVHIMTELTGRVFDDHRTSWPKDQFIQAYGAALKRFHALPFQDCTIDQNIHKRLEDAYIRFQWMDPHEICPYYDYVENRQKEKSRQAIFDYLKANVPKNPQVALTHGDYCYDNILEEDGVFKFLDLGRGGLADIYQDIALAVRNIHEDFGQEALEILFKSYGLEGIDYEKINYYILLDELF